MNDSPDNNTNLRSSAFHLHFKYDGMNFETTCELVRVMDLYLGIPSLLIEPENDRRKLYGKAGEFRFHEEKTMEYRVLSGFFSKNSDLRKWAFKNAMTAIQQFNRGVRINPMFAQKVHDIINYRDLRQAEKLINDNQISMLFAA